MGELPEWLQASLLLFMFISGLILGWIYSWIWLEYVSRRWCGRKSTCTDLPDYYDFSGETWAWSEDRGNEGV